MQFITNEQWTSFERDGYLRLGPLLNDDMLAALQQRIDEIMLGTAAIDYDRVMMQLDPSTSEYKDISAQTKGHKASTRHYRKIQDLELDPLFLDYMRHPVARELCARTYGPDTPIASYRAMFMNKPAGSGTFLPWHQDRWTHLDRDPLLTLWTALDPATAANGCVQVLPSSHRMGLINPEHPSGFLTDEQSAAVVEEVSPMHLELDAGEAVLLHNWLLHSSDTNHTKIARRAFSVCYMDANTVCSNGGEYPVIFGEGAFALEMVL